MSENLGFKHTPDLVDRQSPKRRIGFGAGLGSGSTADKISRFVGQCQSYSKEAIYALPILETTTQYFGGPLLDSDIDKGFGGDVNPLRVGFPGATQTESTMADPSEFQVPYAVCGIGWIFEPDPLVFAMLGNSYTTPLVPGVTKPVSSDSFTASDLTNDAGDTPLKLAGARQAVLDYSAWAEEAFYHMARAYTLQWQVGNRTLIMNQALSTVASTPSNAQNGSSSSSDIDPALKILEGNRYYTNLLGSTRNFATIDYTRYGHVDAGVFGSVNHPTRAYKIAPATYGAMGLRSFLKGNQEVYRLAVPIIVPAGVKIGLKLQLSSNIERDLMKKYMSSTFGIGGATPAQLTDGDNWAVGATATVGETSLSAGNTVHQIATMAGADHFKFGPWKIKLVFKGAELTDEQCALLKSPEARDVIQSECGCQFPMWKSA